jgi:hypothetical protein
MRVFGENVSVKQLRQRVGRMDQVAGIRLVQFDDGRARPARAALIHTGGGLEITVALDRCMDIAAASHAGRAMGWRSAPGDVAPQYYEAEGIRWLRSYGGGLLTTCGLSNVGGPAADSAESGVGLHGRIGNIPAEDLSVTQEWQGNDYVLRLRGTMREVVLFGEKLALSRSIHTKLGENRFWIEDTVVNEGFEAVPLMLLYHCNIGWPALGPKARMISPTRGIAPRDETARDGVESWNEMDAPTRKYAEKVYYHDMAAARDGSVTTAIENGRFGEGEGFGVYVKYVKKELPRFTQWKMMGQQDYVLGLEPCNCGVEGRDVEAKHGLLEKIQPGERRVFRLELGALTSEDELHALQKPVARIRSQIRDSYLDFVKKPG